MLVYYIDNEELAFYTLVHIMYNKGWRMIYVENMPKLTELLQVLSKLLQRHVPEVHQHLHRFNVRCKRNMILD